MILTPPYRNQNIDQPVTVYFQLQRPKDGEVSEPKPFQYIPDDPGMREGCMGEGCKREGYKGEGCKGEGCKGDGLAIKVSLLWRLNSLWSKLCETNAMFRPASMGLDHTLVVCDLTQILAEGSCCRCYPCYSSS